MLKEVLIPHKDCQIKFRKNCVNLHALVNERQNLMKNLLENSKEITERRYKHTSSLAGDDKSKCCPKQIIHVIFS